MLIAKDAWIGDRRWIGSLELIVIAAWNKTIVERASIGGETVGYVTATEGDEFLTVERVGGKKRNVRGLGAAADYFAKWPVLAKV